MPLILWTGAELNRRHTAFQAVALPTELPVQILLKSASEALLTSSQNSGSNTLLSDPKDYL